MTSGQSMPLTGMEPALGTGRLLRSAARITLAGIRSRRGSKSALRNLIHTLQHAGSSELRVSAAKALGEISAPEAALALTSAAVSDSAVIVRAACAHALGRIGTEQQLDPLLRLLEDPAERVRESAVRGIANLALKNEQRPEIVRAVARSLGLRLQDSSPHVQEVALAMLGWIGGADAFGVLHQAVNSSDPEVQQRARIAMQWAAGKDLPAADQPPAEIAAYSKRYRNPVAGGWAVAKELLPPITMRSHLITAAACVLAVGFAIWYATLTRIPAWLPLPVLIAMPVIVFTAAWMFTFRYREHRVIQLLKLTPLLKPVVHWGYVLTTLYRLRVPILFTSIFAFYHSSFVKINNVDPVTGVLEVDTLSGLALGISYFSSNLFIVYLGTAQGFEPPGNSLTLWHRALFALVAPGWLLLYRLIFLMLPDVGPVMAVTCFTGVTLILAFVFGPTLYRIRNDA